jgi:hypothetical protein
LKIQTLAPFDKSPRKLISLLIPPDGSGNSGKPLHPENRKQYDISELFPENSKYKNTFKNVLLSPNGILLHSSNCSNAENCSATSIYLQSFPKFVFKEIESRKITKICHCKRKLG